MSIDTLPTDILSNNLTNDILSNNLTNNILSINTLPTDILLNIIDNLDIENTFKLSSVNKFFDNFLRTNNKYIKPITLYHSNKINKCISKYKDVKIIYKAYDNFEPINNVYNIIELDLCYIYINNEKIGYINKFINVTKLIINCEKCESLDNLNLNILELDLYNCININYNYLIKCTNLKKLYISSYKTDYLVLNLDNLEDLNLYWTDIKKCKLNCNNLKKLKINDNYLSSIEDLDLLKKLECLDLMCNNINNLNGITNLINLNDITLIKCNNLVLLENYLSNIEYIHIYNLTTLINLKNLNKVKKLYLDLNYNLKTLDISNSINLEILEINNNNLLNDIIGLDKCIKLKKLDINCCNSQLELNLDNNINIEELYLHNYSNTEKLHLHNYCNNINFKNNNTLILDNVSINYNNINYTKLNYLYLKNIKDKNFNEMGKLAMRDSNCFHAVCMDTYPPLFYLNDKSKEIIRLVNAYNKFEQLDKDDLKIFYSFDAGPNAFLFILDKHFNEFVYESNFSSSKEGYTSGSFFSTTN
jgi:hypothetical protein